VKVGAEPRKLAVLALLLVVLAYVAYTNLLSPEPAAAPAGRAPQPAPARVPALASREAPEAAAAARPVLGEFRASLKPDRRERRLDPASIDPTLRLDLLARVQAVSPSGGTRNLFQFGPPPAPKAPPEPKIIPKTPGPRPDGAPEKPPEPPKPPPPPIPLKFFGYAGPARAAQKQAFFLDGEDIIVAGEGEIIKKRYKVVRIGVNSAVVEDLEHKHQQTLALEVIS
jgi:hypothetical protein